MKTFRFRDFVIYRSAREFRKIVRFNLAQFPSTERFRLADQIHRSSISILLNIAEGSAKGTDKDFARYLGIAISSLNEVIAGFEVALDDGFLQQDQFQIIETAAERLAKQIGSFIQRLRVSSPRYKSKPYVTS